MADMKVPRVILPQAAESVKVYPDTGLFAEIPSESDGIGKAMGQPLTVIQSASGDVFFSAQGIVAYRKFPGFTPRFVASLVSGTTYGQVGNLVTVIANGHGITAALNGQSIYWPGSAAIPAGFYPDFLYIDANTFSFLNPLLQIVAGGSLLIPTLPYTLSARLSTRNLYGDSISSTGKLIVDFTSICDSLPGLKSLQVKIGGAQCGLHQVGSTPNISGSITICANGATNKQISTGGVDGNVSSALFQTTADTTIDQSIDVFLQMSGASQWRSVVSLIVREFP